MPETQSPEILTVQQVAVLLDLHPETVRRYIAAGELNATKVGRSWRIRRSDVDAMLDGETDDE